MGALQQHWIAFAVALGCGLLIGIERERRKGSGAGRAPAGVRSFAIASLAGALAQALEQPLLVGAGALSILALTSISHWKSRSRDPGVTTELALFVTYLLGVFAVESPVTAAAGAAIVTALLAARGRLHRFATDALSAAEARDGLVLAVAAMVVLPLVPDRALPWLADVNPRVLWRLVVVLLALQAAGYVATRLAGARIGLAVSGLASGFVSSTATFAAMGARVRATPAMARAAAGGALFSNVATLAQLAIVAATASPRLLALLWPALAVGALVASGAALACAWRAGAGDPVARPPDRMFDLPRSLGFAALLVGLTALCAWGGQRFGARVAIASSALAGFVDVHASLASVCAQVEAGLLRPADGVLPVLLGFTANSIGKLAAAWAGGGGAFALRVLPGLAALLCAVWATALAR